MARLASLLSWSWRRRLRRRPTAWWPLDRSAVAAAWALAVATRSLTSASWGRQPPQRAPDRQSRSAVAFASLGVEAPRLSAAGPAAEAAAAAAPVASAGAFAGRPRRRCPPPRRGARGAPAARAAAALPALAAPAASAAAVSAWPLSGIWETLSAIFLSELGDKTFFLTMVLAVRRGRFLALASSQTALWTMTAISVTLGVVLRKLPTQFGAQSLVNVAAGALMLVFGVQSLYESGVVSLLRGLARGRSAAGAGGQAAAAAAGGAGDADVSEACTSEFDEAECEIDSALLKAKAVKNPVLEWLRFTVLIFLAEWGDRSMFVTVTLAAARSPVGTFLGGCVGHFCAALLAVISGGILEKYVSEQLVQIVAGSLFCVFGVTTLAGVY